MIAAGDRAMPSFFVGSCPRCGAEKMTLDVRGVTAFSGGSQDVLVSCRACKRGSLFRIDYVANNLFAETEGFLKFPPSEVIPAAAPGPPDDVPDAVARTFRQALANLLLGNFDAAGAMYRKTLDVATAIIDPTLKNKSFNDRINALEASRQITPSLKEWAHEVRIDGNSAAHDQDELTPDQVTQLAAFTEMFLVYTFTMPAKLAAKRAATTTP